jgi:hypothetical protein
MIAKIVNRIKKIGNGKSYKAVYFGTQAQANLKAAKLDKSGECDVDISYGEVFVPEYNGLTKKEKLIKVNRWIVYCRKRKKA